MVFAAVTGRPGARSDFSRTAVLGDHHVVASVLAEQLTETVSACPSWYDIGHVERRYHPQQQRHGISDGRLPFSASLGRAEVCGPECVFRHTAVQSSFRRFCNAWRLLMV